MSVKWRGEQNGISVQLNTLKMHCGHTIIMDNLLNIVMVNSLPKNIASNVKHVVLVKVIAGHNRNNAITVQPRNLDNLLVDS